MNVLQYRYKRPVMTDKQTREIGKRMKQHRLQAGLSQAGLAEISGMNTNAYAKIERGENEPTLGTIKKLSKALGVKASDILGY